MAAAAVAKLIIEPKLAASSPSSPSGVSSTLPLPSPSGSSGSSSSLAGAGSVAKKN